MRYKTLLIQKLDHVDATIQRIDRALSMNDTKQALDLLENLKERMDDVRGTVNIEPDDFEQQFRP